MMGGGAWMGRAACVDGIIEVTVRLVLMKLTKRWWVAMIFGAVLFAVQTVGAVDPRSASGVELTDKGGLRAATFSMW